MRVSWLQHREQLDNKVVLLYVGRLSWEKNLSLLVQAFHGMDHQCCHLAIVGDGPARAEIQQQLADFPVTFMGYLHGEALATVYASADVFAFPSCTETFGQVVLEAVASGSPVVGLYSEGVCDLVSDGQTGLLDVQRLHKEEQVTSYRERLEYLIQDHSARYTMGQTAVSEAQRRSWPEAMQCLVQGYSEAVESVRRGIAA